MNIKNNSELKPTDLESIVTNGNKLKTLIEKNLNKEHCRFVSKFQDI